MSFCFILAVILGVVSSDDLECSVSTYGIDWSAGYSNYESDMPDYVWSHVSVGDCDRDDSFCAAADIDGTFTINTKVLGWDVTASKSFDVTHEFCASELTCNLFGDGVEGNCVSSTYAFEYWQPLSCDEDKDFNELIINYDLNTRFYCCNSDNCNTAPFDQLNCPENNDLSNYLTALTDCWNTVKKAWQKDLYCNADNYAINYYKTCCLYGDCAKESHRKRDRCTYYATCTTTLESILADFGECACQAATDNNYDGAIINELMGTHWEDFCPNAVIQCDSGGELSLKKYLYYAKYIYYLDIDPDKADYYAQLVQNHLVNETGQDASVSTAPPVTIPPGSTAAPFRRRLENKGPIRRRIKSDGTIQESFYSLPSIKTELKLLDTDNKKSNDDDDDEVKTVQVGYVVTLEYQTQRDMNYMVGWLDENGDDIVLDATGIMPDPSYTSSERREKDITDEATEGKKSNATTFYPIYVMAAVVMAVVGCVV